MKLPAAAPALAADEEPLPPSRTSTVTSTANHHLLFNKRKVLPHPRKDTAYPGLRKSRPAISTARNADPFHATSKAPLSAGTASDDASTNSPPSSPRTLKQYPKTLGNGPDLPPTPPAHSRNSSSSYSVLPPSVTYVQSPDRSTDNVVLKPLLPTTPTKQMSPPTPDVTPPYSLPQDVVRLNSLPLRPPLRDRAPSKSNSDSRTESFRTAREHQSSSSDDDAAQAASKLAVPVLPIPPTRTTKSTARNFLNGEKTAKKLSPRAVGLGLGLESSPDSLTPTSKRDFVSFDGEWGGRSGEAAKEWDDDRRGRNVVAGYDRISPPTSAGEIGSQEEVIENPTVTPTNAIKALRNMPLPHKVLRFPSPSGSDDQSRSQKQHQPKQQPSKRSRQQEPGHGQTLTSAAPLVTNMVHSSDSLESDRGRRPSMSSRSTTSNVLDTVLISSPPQRRRTLRHVKKQPTLRNVRPESSPASSSAPTSLLDEAIKQRRPHVSRFDGSRHDSVVSTATINSIQSRSARREVWKAGGIPVLVVPDRISSVRSTSREPSLRSTSSRRSRRSHSVHSVPLSQFSKSRDISPCREQRGRRGKPSYSESGDSALDGSAPGDQRTMDFPPIVPRRTSSLSAPTSRNASRSGSLTTESTHAHSALLYSRLKEQEKAQMSAETKRQRKVVLQRPIPMKGQDPEDSPLLPAETAIASREAPKHQEKQQQDIVLPPEARGNNDAPAEPIIPTKAYDGMDVCQQEDDAIQDGDNNIDEYRNNLDPRSSLEPYGDRSSVAHLSPHNTPFSMVSVETTTTHHSQVEVSEALAVSIYPHQNTSVLVVDHSNRPSDGSESSQPDRMTDSTELSTVKHESTPISEFTPAPLPSSLTEPITKPETTASDRDAMNDMPVTPLQPIFSLDDVDSPLRNPRSPPVPPAINLIPATPSGLTPSTDQMQTRDNPLEEAGDGRPHRRRSVSVVLRRALSRGRNTAAGTEYGPSASRSGGILTRTLSLTRDMQRKAWPVKRSQSVDRSKRLSFDIEPTEEDKLHPFWRPMTSHQLGEDSFSRGLGDGEDETYRYPPIDNRPNAPRRSLSSRMKRTFAILPLDDDDFYPATSSSRTDRRTVRRTPSGNLRVVKHRGSVDSLRKRATAIDQRPYTATGHDSHKFAFWRGPFGKGRGGADDDVGAVDNGKRMRATSKILPVIGDKIGEYGPHTIPRRFSERRREKRSRELRQMISRPQEVRDGVGEMIRRTNYRDTIACAQTS